MPTENMTAYVLADNEAPYANALGYGKIDVEREELLSEAFSLLLRLDENQLKSIFEELQGG